MLSLRPASLFIAGAFAVGLLVVLGPLGSALKPDHVSHPSPVKGPYPVLAPVQSANADLAAADACSNVSQPAIVCGESTGFDFYIRQVSTLEFPENVDSNSPSVRIDDNLLLFNSASGHTYRSSGDSVTNLNETLEVTLPVLERPGNVWMEALWRDPETSLLYGWYHFEPADLPCLPAPIIGAAVSADDGLTWEDKGFVLESAYDFDCDYDNGFITGGNGDLDVVFDQPSQSFYFLFSNYAGPLEEQGIGVARSSLADKGQPGTVFKYHDSGWSEPGIGGKVSAIFPAVAGWKGPFTDAFWGPSVHWNTYLNQYVAVINHTVGEDYTQEGTYITFSRDLLSWTIPQKIVDGGDWYPELIGISAEGTSSVAGQALRLYVHGASESLIEFERQPDSADSQPENNP